MGESEKIGMRGFVRKIERATVVRAIRGGLIIIIPVLIRDLIVINIVIHLIVTILYLLLCKIT